MINSREGTSHEGPLIDLLRTVLAELAPVIGAIMPQQLHEPTPCSDWDVEQLRTHPVGWRTTFAASFADPPGQTPRADLDSYTLSVRSRGRGTLCS